MLINIVFLVLIGLLIAGSLWHSVDREATLVETVVAVPISPPDALTLHGNGQLSFRGKAMSTEDYIVNHVKSGETVRLLADRKVRAGKLLQVAAKLRDGGASRVWVISQRAIK
ncbi:MAG: biopolymer transporter ExbD [Pseudomonadota bacterium]